MVYIPKWTITIESTDIAPIRVNVEFKLNDINKIYFLTTKSYYDDGTVAKFKSFDLKLGSWSITKGVITKIIILDNELVEVYGFEIGYLLDDEIFRYDQGQTDKTDVFFNDTADVILDRVLEGSSFSRGSCPSDTISVEFRGLTRLSCIKKLARILGKDWWVVNDKVYIGEKGSSKGTLSSYRIIKKEYDYEGIINRIYLRRMNGGVITTGLGKDYVEDTTSQSNYKLRSAVYVADTSADDDTAISEAQKLLDMYKDPKTILDVRTTLKQIEDLQVVEGDTITIGGSDYRVKKFILSERYEVRLDLESIKPTLTGALEETTEVVNEHRLLLTKVWDLDAVPGSLLPRDTGLDLGSEEHKWDDVHITGVIEKPTEIDMAGSSSAWRYRVPITITNSGSDESDVVVEITLDTQSLISAGKMQSDGDDIRFSTDTAMKNELNYWIKSGINTSSTKIYVRVPDLPNGDTTIYLWYGNSSVSGKSSKFDTLVYSGNMISNGGFESGSLSPWTSPYNESNSASVKSTVWYNHSGMYGCELDSYSGGTYYAADIKQERSVESYAESISLWYKLPHAADNVDVHVKYKDGTETSDSLENQKEDWTYFSMDCNRDKQLDFVWIDRTTDSTKSCAIDDVVVPGWYKKEPSSYSVSVGSETDLYSPSIIQSDSFLRINSLGGSDLLSIYDGSSEKFKIDSSGKIATESVWPVSIKATNSPSDGYVLSYDASSGKFEWTSSGGSSVDEKVKADSGDSTAGYLSDKVDDSTIKVDTGSHELYVYNSPRWTGYGRYDNQTFGGDIDIGNNLWVAHDFSLGGKITSNLEMDSGKYIKFQDEANDKIALFGEKDADNFHGLAIKSSTLAFIVPSDSAHYFRWYGRESGSDTKLMELDTNGNLWIKGQFTSNESDFIKWMGNQNMRLEATGNNQNWSFDMRPGSYTGTYWGVYSDTKGFCLKIYHDSGLVETGYDFKIGGNDILDSGGTSRITLGDPVVFHASLKGSSGGAIRVSTGYGWLDLGPKNTSWCHFYTDRSRFYFNKGLTVDTGAVGSYNQDLYLQRAGTTKMQIMSDKIRTVDDFEVGGDLQINGGDIKDSDGNIRFTIGSVLDCHDNDLKYVDEIWARSFMSRYYYIDDGMTVHFRGSGTYTLWFIIPGFESGYNWTKVRFYTSYNGFNADGIDIYVYSTQTSGDSISQMGSYTGNANGSSSSGNYRYFDCDFTDFSCRVSLIIKVVAYPTSSSAMLKRIVIWNSSGSYINYRAGSQLITRWG